MNRSNRLSQPSFTLVINAGGQSRRMGQPKALLPVPPYNLPLLRYILQRLQPLATGPAVVIANDPELVRLAHLPDDIRVASDRYPETGTLGGIATGLGLCREWAIMVACDMPLLNPAIFQWMQSLTADHSGDGKEWDAIVPVIDGYEEPLHALYHRRCLPAIEARLAAGERRANCFLKDVRTRFLEEEEVRRLDPRLRSFFNANTPDEWQAALAMMQEDAASDKNGGVAG